MTRRDRLTRAAQAYTVVCLTYALALIIASAPILIERVIQ